MKSFVALVGLTLLNQTEGCFQDEQCSMIQSCDLTSVSCISTSCTLDSGCETNLCSIDTSGSGSGTCGFCSDTNPCATGYTCRDEVSAPSCEGDSCMCFEDCASTADCSNSQACFAGTGSCFTTCTTDSDCEYMQQTCNSSQGCVQQICQENHDCRTQNCDFLAGECIQCQSSTECSAGYRCEPATHIQCINSCTSNDDCVQLGKTCDHSYQCLQTECFEDSDGTKTCEACEEENVCAQYPEECDFTDIHPVCIVGEIEDNSLSTRFIVLCIVFGALIACILVMMLMCKLCRKDPHEAAIAEIKEKLYESKEKGQTEDGHTEDNTENH